MDPIPPPPSLPETIPDTLRVFGVRPISWSDILIFLLLVGALVWIFLRRRRKAAAPAPAPTKATVTIPGFGDKIRQIEERHLAAQTYREGCHELDIEVRRHLEKECTRQAPALTADEIVDLFADAGVGRFATTLRDCAFKREPPARDDFRMHCREARVLFGEKRKYELRTLRRAPLPAEGPTASRGRPSRFARKEGPRAARAGKGPR